MSPAVLKTCSLGTVLVGRPIKHQRQPLGGPSFKLRLLTDSYLRISVKHQVSTQRVATVSLASKVYSADIIGGRQAAGERGNLIGGCSWHQSTLPAAGYINRQASSADFCG